MKRRIFIQNIAASVGGVLSASKIVSVIFAQAEEKNVAKKTLKEKIIVAYLHIL